MTSFTFVVVMWQHVSRVAVIVSASYPDWLYDSATGDPFKSEYTIKVGVQNMIDATVAFNDQLLHQQRPITKYKTEMAERHCSAVLDH